MNMSKSFLKHAREVARHCKDKGLRKILQERTDELQNVFSRFTISCSPDDMIDLVAMWTRVALAVNAIQQLGSDNPNGGSMPLPKPLEKTTAVA
jgi:hypothetical protein